MRFQSIFVTGTDTAVGKTTVTCGLASALSRRGLSVGVLKPVETGCPTDQQRRLSPQDAMALQHFADCRLDLYTICPYHFEPPVAPFVAAQQQGVDIEVEQIVHAHRRISSAHDVTLVEGAGGLLVPLTSAMTFADLAARLEIPLLVVVASRLGAINHALLTVRYARALGLRVLGYVVNFLTDGSDLAAQTNISVLSELLGPPIGVMPYIGQLRLTASERQRAAEIIERALRVDDLLVEP